jgi:hypothetical protein
MEHTSMHGNTHGMRPCPVVAALCGATLVSCVCGMATQKTNTSGLERDCNALCWFVKSIVSPGQAPDGSLLTYTWSQPDSCAAMKVLMYAGLEGIRNTVPEPGLK